MDPNSAPQRSTLKLNEEGIVLYLKVNYKVLFLVVVLIDLFHASVNEMIHYFIR
jgi:hypothetical protein